MPELHIQNKKENTGHGGRRAFLALAIMLALQIGTYGYLVNASVGHVVSRMALEKSTDNLSSKTSNLESEYFALQNGVTIETANSLHYTSTAHVQYIDDRGESVVMLTRGN